jgi:Protein of unknown function (DUF3800)
MILQGYFDDSGSDAGSKYYVLAGLIATVEEWKTVSSKWAQVRDKEPSLRYFKMSEAMAMDGQFKSGWTVPLRNQRIMEFVDIIQELDPPRIECFLKRSNFVDFVTGILQGPFNDPYFLCFYHLILSIAANGKTLGWNRDCDFIFDNQGELGKNAVAQWEWAKQDIRVPVNEFLGSPPIFRDDVKFLPLQAADMLAWLVRDCMTRGPDGMEEIARAALKHIEGRKILRIHIDKGQLVQLGANFLVGKARMYGHL